MARSAWSGAVEFGGFPIHLRAYSLIKSKSAQSLKNLCPCHGQPVVMPKSCATTGDPIDGEPGKGIEVGKKLYILDDDAIDALAKADRTDVLTIKALPPRSTVPLHLGMKQYRLVPDESIPGATGPANILWNGLRGNDRTLIAEWVMRTGSRNELVAVCADTYGLTAVVLPYASDFNAVPEHAFTEDAAQVQMFVAFATQQGIPLDDFAHAAIEDEYGKRRAEVIDKVIAGEPVPVTASAPAKAAVPDLMAAMQAAMQSAPTTASTKAKAPAKSRAKAKA